ncbi:MAG TPA: molybdenum cofactor biosynthesis protein MoaE [Solirubrobacteraceae bacterium]
MTVRVRLFAMLRERAGSDVLELELPEGASVAEALAAPAIAALTGDLHCVLAVNRVYAPPGQVLVAGDEIALIPPVSGGAAPRVPHIAVTAAPLALEALAARVRDPRAGAVVVFEGLTREVDELHYEAYAEMAIEAMREIALAAIERHGLCAAAAEHRVGVVPLSEPSVIVAASAPHRGEAFAGAREMIDAIKASAPIWKLEVEDDERRWVEGTPPAPPDER